MSDPRTRNAVSAPSRSVALVTLGCARNEVDSEELAGTLAARGWSLTDSDADRVDHMRHGLILISPFQWSRWLSAAVKLGVDGATLAAEIHVARTDPTRENVARCADIARRIESTATGMAKRIAETTALEMEAAAA